MESLLEIDLHDAKIIEFVFKSISDFNDLITIDLKSDSFESTFNTDKIQLQIRECYKARIEFNMWIAGSDTIRRVEILRHSEWIETERRKDDFGPKDIKHLIVELNTSASMLQFLLSQDVIVLPLDRG